MCQTAVISNQIVRLATRSFKQTLEAVSGNQFPVARLSRFNKGLDNFYEFLYSQINNVSKEDYKIFGPQLTLMLSSIGDLYHTCLSLPKSWGFDTETERLGRNYSALVEINGDLKRAVSTNSSPRFADDPELRSLLAEAGKQLQYLAR